MTYKIEWQIPKRVLTVTYRGEITIDDLKNVNADLQNHYAEGIAPIHVISHIDTEKFPKDLKMIRTLLSTLNQKDWGWFIVVGFESSLGRFFMVMVTNTFKLQAKAVSTIEEALDVLSRIDQSLVNESNGV